MPTELRVESSAWWPTKGSPARNDYAGSAACAKCHAGKTASQTATPMAHAAVRAVAAQPLVTHPELNFTFGPYKYQLTTKNGESQLTVTNGVDSATKDLEWALGNGSFGQSYVYRENGKFYEAQLSFYTATGALDITTGHSLALPQNLEMAAGGYTAPDNIRQCFGCHSTASTANNRFDPDQAIMGVTCEACHGPGVEHVALMTADSTADNKLIMNPAKLSPVDSVDFCGTCHRTYSDAVLQGLSGMGVINVRLQPYRLEKSRCWGNGDRKLTCVACHDPHVPLVRGAEFYDGKCLQCHNRANSKQLPDHPGKACLVGTKSCVSCHMPKVEVPGTHSDFTDHWIRIVRPGEPYPT